MAENLYSTLGVSPTATPEEIKRAYRVLARKYHPDSGNPDSSEDLFQEVQEAYSVLSNEEKRKAYDERHGFLNEALEQIARFKRNQEASEKLRAREDSMRSLRETRSHSASADEPVAKRFTKEKSGGVRELLGKVTNSFKRESGSALWERLVGSDEPEDSDSIEAGDADEDLLRGERVYQFAIDALESISGTFREVALQDQHGPRMLRIKIPAGVINGALLKVNCPARGNEPERVVHARVAVHPHSVVEREGADILLKIPITVREAIHGAELEVPTVDGPMKLRLPPRWDLEKRLRIKEKGISREGRRSDIYVRFYVVVPTSASAAVNDAADALEANYLNPVRVNVPKTLIRG